MSNYLNRTIIVGRVANEPKMQCGFLTFGIPNGDILNVIIVKNEGQIKAVKDHLKYGDLCCVEGKLETQLINDKTYPTVIAEKIIFLSERKNRPTEG